MAGLFTIASDDALCAMIFSAKERLVLVAPGLSEPVADAFAARIARDGGPPVVSVILDIDSEVCRLGFGKFDAVEKLRTALIARGGELQLQEGVRIGVAIADSEVLIYSPTPMLVEAGPKSENRPNAIRLSGTVPESIAAACGVGKAAYGETAQELGLGLADSTRIEATKADLAENPPREFDLARLERVFSYKLEYVEFSVSGFRLKTRTVSLPAELLGLGDKKLKERIHNTFRIFDESTLFEVEIPFEAPERAEQLQLSLVRTKIDEKWLNQRALKIRKDYFIPLGTATHGNLILKRRKAAFLAEVQKFGELVDLYAAEVEKNMERMLHQTMDDLVESLFQRVKASPPVSWLERSVSGHLSDDDLRQRLEQELDQAFADLKDSYEPKVECVFKGVNYETITSDKDFRQGIEKFFGKREALELLSEYDASRAKDTQGK